MSLEKQMYSSPEFEYSDLARGGKEKLKSNRRINHAHGSRPSQHNGIHRRRNKKFAW
jgi:hypothetical protein